jgi:DNA-binding winged helix-turn-helix (wHTH) protein/TolB-like protein/Flp pilus assembly protein TadD
VVKRPITNGVRRFYEFGPFRLDPNRQRLLRDGEVVPLSPKAIQTLILLVQNPGKLLERQALMEALWPDTIVEDANLTVAVSQLRKAINQNGDTGEFIQTIPRVGYRFVADIREVVEELARLKIEAPAVLHTVVEGKERGTNGQTVLRTVHSPTPTNSPFARRQNRIPRIAALLVVTLSAIALLLYQFGSRNPEGALRPTKSKTLAVLPFQVTGPKNAEDEYLGPGVSDSLNTRLSKVKQFALRPTSSVLRFDTPDQKALEAGRKLAVEGVMQGRIEHVGDRVRVTAQLLRVRDGALLWSESFDEPFTGLSAVEENISRQVTQALQLKLAPEEQQQFASRATDSPEAFHAYLRGRYALNKRTNDEVRKAIKFFQQAIELDPAYAAAYAGLADSYLLLGDYDEEPPNETFPFARGAALRALEIDETLAEAHASLAHAKFLFYWDWAAAEHEYLRAIELKPNYATAHHWYAMFLSAMGRSDEAMREIKLAEDLDPLSLIIRANIGTIEYFARQYDQAVEQEQKLLKTDPNFVQARRKLAFALEAKGMMQEAITEWLTIEKQLGVSGETLEAYKKACASSGIKGYWLLALENDKKEVGHEAGSLSSYYARLGDREQAFYWLDRAFDQHAPWLVYAKVTSVYDNLRSDLRFHAFLQRMGL